MLLGALLITKLQLAAMSRVDIPEEKRRDFFLYVDEFQNFATESFANILSEARKYRLSLILAHQYIAQMEEEVADAVFGNVGTIVSFRVGAEDAEYLEKEFTPDFIAGDLVNLGKYNIYLKLMIDGIAGRPFSAETLPPAEPLEKSCREKIIKVSRERYGTARQIVEEKISRWLDVQTTLPASTQSAATTLYNIKCSRCGKEAKVIFPPDSSRPVYCKSCLNKIDREKMQTASGLAEGMPKEQPILLKEAFEKEPVPFSPQKREISEKLKRKPANIGELKKLLEESLETPHQNKFGTGQEKETKINSKEPNSDNENG
jgi:CxxC-x17-CxxC domain-containing protein